MAILTFARFLHNIIGTGEKTPEYKLHLSQRKIIQILQE